jgi:hypothetical protein
MVVLRHLFICAIAAIGGDLAGLVFVRSVYRMTFKLDRDYHDFILWLSISGVHTFLVLCTLAYWFRDWNSTRRLRDEVDTALVGILVGAILAIVVVPYGILLLLTGEAFVASGVAFLLYPPLDSLLPQRNRIRPAS